MIRYPFLVLASSTIGVPIAKWHRLYEDAREMKKRSGGRSATAGLRRHDRDDIFLRMHADFSELQVVREHLALENELDLQDRIELVLLLHVLLDLRDREIGVNGNHFDGLVGRNARQPEPELSCH